MKKSILALLALLFLLPANATAITSKPYKNVRYGSLSDQELDIYLPPQTIQNAPVIIYVHGGGWTVGNKSNVHSKANAFNQDGYIFVSIEYPKLPEHPVETQASSIALAVSWIERNIYKYDGNSKSLTLMGHSSGAHLVALISTDPEYLKKHSLSPKDINAVIHLDGAALHIPNHMKHTRKNSPNANLYNNAFGKDQKRWDKLSPYKQLEINKYAPPFILLTAGRAMSKHDSKNFAAQLQKKEIKYIYKDLQSRSHSSINKKFGKNKNEEAFQLTMDFLHGLD